MACRFYGPPAACAALHSHPRGVGAERREEALRCMVQPCGEVLMPSGESQLCERISEDSFMLSDQPHHMSVFSDRSPV